MSNIALLAALILPAQPPVLTEAAPNPLYESSGEFVEIWNPSPTPVSLSGWSLTDGDALDPLEPWDEGVHGTFPHPGMLTGTDTLPPGGFALVFELDYAGSPCYADIPMGTLILTTGDLALCNGLAASSDPLTLFGPGGTADSCVVSTYGTPVPSDVWQNRDDDGLDGIPFDPGDGCTVERYPPGAPDQEGCWFAGPPGGTPGLPAEPPPDTLDVSCDDVWTFPADPEPGMPFEIAASFTLLGSTSPGSGDVTLFLDADGDSTASGGEVLAVFQVAGMLPGTTDTISATASLDRGWYLPSLRAEVEGDGCPENDHVGSILPVGGGIDPVLTEVMSNPVEEDSDEYLEVFYPGPGLFPLAGCSLTDGDAVDAIISWSLPPLGDTDAVYSPFLPTGAFALILDPEYAGGAQPYDLPPGTRVLTITNTTIGNGLTGNDPLTLYDPFGTTQSCVVSTFGTPASSDDPLLCDDDGLDGIPFDPGDDHSLERRSATHPDAEGSWIVSPTGGTPGAPAQVADTVDACVTSLTLAPESPAPGDPVLMTATVLNDGTLPTAPGSVVLFLDQDADSTASSGEILAVLPVGVLLPASCDSASTVFVCPETGWYLAAAAVEVPGDQNPSNDVTVVQFRSGDGIDAVISEVLCNPSSEDTDEFVEIHYPGPGAFDVAGCRFTDGDAVDVIVPWDPEAGAILDQDAAFGTVLTAGAFGVVLDSEYAAGSQPWDLPPGTVVMTTSNTTLGDGLSGTDPLTLYGTGGTTSSDVMSTFGTPVASDDPLERDDDGLDGIPRDPGEDQSLQRLDPSGPDEEDNWAASPGGPTPGGPFPDDYLGINVSALLVSCDPPMGSGDACGTLTTLVACTGTDPVPDGALSILWFCDLDADGVPEPGELLAESEAGPLCPGDTLETQVLWTTVGGESSILSLSCCDLDAVPEDDSVSCPWNRTGPLLLNEIMYAPAEGEPEWIELYNAGTRQVDLMGWRFEDSSEQVVLCTDTLLLDPGAFAIASGDTAAFRSAWPGVTCPLLEPSEWPALNNSTQQGQDYADLLTLRDPPLEPADHVPYDDDWGGGTGVSLERRGPGLDGWLAASWTGCSAGGTPGAPNACLGPEPGGAFLEYLPDPFSPDGDGRDDLLAISCNPGAGVFEITLTVYNVQGRVSRVLVDREEHAGAVSLYWDGTGGDGGRLPIGRYIVHVRAVSRDTGETREACGVVVLALPL